jgi:hypothetical protein
MGLASPDRLYRFLFFKARSNPSECFFSGFCIAHARAECSPLRSSCCSAFGGTTRTGGKGGKTRTINASASAQYFLFLYPVCLPRSLVLFTPKLFALVSLHLSTSSPPPTPGMGFRPSSSLGIGKKKRSREEKIGWTGKAQKIRPRSVRLTLARVMNTRQMSCTPIDIPPTHQRPRVVSPSSSFSHIAHEISFTNTTRSVCRRCYYIIFSSFPLFFRRFSSSAPLSLALFDVCLS